MKLAEQLSHKDVASQTSAELSALEDKLNKFVALEPCEDSELESAKEVTQRERLTGRFIDYFQE